MAPLIRIVGVDNLIEAWRDILGEGWTTTPRRKVPPSAQRFAPAEQRNGFMRGSASDASFK